MMMDHLRKLEHKLVNPIAVTLAPYVSANVVSVLSLLAAVGAGASFWAGMPVAGAVLILLNGFLDMLDGCVARARGTVGPFGSFVDKIIDKYADLVFLLGMLLGGLAHPAPAIVAMVGIPLATYINAAVESLTQGEMKFQERLSLRFLRIILLVAGGLSRQTRVAVWLVAATVVYAVVSRTVQSLVFLRRRSRQAAEATSPPPQSTTEPSGR
jgi:archaetidylinositol phosphate synthase